MPRIGRVGSSPTRATISQIEVPISKLFLVKIKFTSRDLFKCFHGAIESAQIRPKDKVEGLSPPGSTRKTAVGDNKTLCKPYLV